MKIIAQRDDALFIQTDLSFIAIFGEDVYQHKFNTKKELMEYLDNLAKEMIKGLSQDKLSRLWENIKEMESQENIPT